MKINCTDNKLYLRHQCESSFSFATYAFPSAAFSLTTTHRHPTAARRAVERTCRPCRHPIPAAALHRWLARPPCCTPAGSRSHAGSSRLFCVPAGERARRRPLAAWLSLGRRVLKTRDDNSCNYRCHQLFSRPAISVRIGASGRHATWALVYVWRAAARASLEIERRWRYINRTQE